MADAFYEPQPINQVSLDDRLQTRILVSSDQYFVWLYQTRKYLQACGLLPYVDGKVLRPLAPHSSHQDVPSNCRLYPTVREYYIAAEIKLEATRQACDELFMLVVPELRYQHRDLDDPEQLMAIIEAQYCPQELPEANFVGVATEFERLTTVTLAGESADDIDKYALEFLQCYNNVIKQNGGFKNVGNMLTMALFGGGGMSNVFGKTRAKTNEASWIYALAREPSNIRALCDRFLKGLQ